MHGDLDPTLGTIFYLAVIFAIIPVVLFVLSRAASPGFQPEPFQLDEIRRLAIQLDQAVTLSLEEAMHAFSSRSGERRALDELIQLAERTEVFRARIQETGAAPGVGSQEFYLLQTAFRRARRGFPRLTAFVKRPERLQPVMMIMDSLRFYFESSLPAPEDRQLVATTASVTHPRSQAVADARPPD